MGQTCNETCWNTFSSPLESRSKENPPNSNKTLKNWFFLKKHLSKIPMLLLIIAVYFISTIINLLIIFLGVTVCIWIGKQKVVIFPKFRKNKREAVVCALS